MYDQKGTAASVEVRGPSAAQVAEWLDALGRQTSACDDAARIDLIAALEQLKSAACAAQARLTVAFKDSQVAQQAAMGVPARRRGTGVNAQVALARRDSPWMGDRLVGLARALVREMPRTLAAMEAGQISEWRATLVVRATACLSLEERAEVDACLEGRLATLSDGQVRAEANRLAYELDPQAFLSRSKRAEADRRVSFRPAPDTMGAMSVLSPIVEHVAMRAALTAEADAKRAAGDPRSRGQIMADTVFQRITGIADAEQVPVEISLVMADTTLLDGDDTPAHLGDYGPIPAPHARRLVRDVDDATAVWLRRLYTAPTTGHLVGMESHRALFEGNLRRLLVLRDEVCRRSWCGAPIRHADHVVTRAVGGETSESNGQGLCEACNYAKEAPGWTARPDPAGGAGIAVTTTTPTGHTYDSRPPPLPGAPPRPIRPATPCPLPVRRAVEMYVLHPIDFYYAA